VPHRIIDLQPIEGLAAALTALDMVRQLFDLGPGELTAEQTLQILTVGTRDSGHGKLLDCENDRLTTHR